MIVKQKRPKAIWTTVAAPGFRVQARQLHPERSKAGGIHARSASESVRLAIYRPIAALFKNANQWCQCCSLLWRLKGYSAPRVNRTEHVHHTKGRDGLLLFDTRTFRAACPECHAFIGDNIEKARRVGLICGKGEWSQQPKE